MHSASHDVWGWNTCPTCTGVNFRVDMLYCAAASTSCINLLCCFTSSLFSCQSFLIQTKWMQDDLTILSVWSRLAKFSNLEFRQNHAVHSDMQPDWGRLLRILNGIINHLVFSKNHFKVSFYKCYTFSYQREAKKVNFFYVLPFQMGYKRAYQTKTIKYTVFCLVLWFMNCKHQCHRMK